MDVVAAFAAEAEAFDQWACRGRDSGDQAAREALVRITRLYLAALALPADREEAHYRVEMGPVDDTEWRAIFDHCARLPVIHYGEVFDPTVLPPEEPLVGSLADDIADIYREVVPGLRAFRAGCRLEAAGHWGSGFRLHWGKHATSAIRALHCWVTGQGVYPLLGT